HRIGSIRNTDLNHSSKSEPAPTDGPLFTVLDRSASGPSSFDFRKYSHRNRKTGENVDDGRSSVESLGRNRRYHGVARGSDGRVQRHSREYRSGGPSRGSVGGKYQADLRWRKCRRYLDGQHGHRRSGEHREHGRDRGG